MKIYHDQSIFAQPLSGFFLKHTALKTVKFPQYPRIQYPTVSLSIPSHVPALSQSAFRRQQRQLMLLMEQQLKEEEEAELELQGVGTTLVGPGRSMLQLELVMQRMFEEENFRSRLRVLRLASFQSFYSFVWLGGCPRSIWSNFG